MKHFLPTSTIKQKRRTSLLNYGINNGEFKPVNAAQTVYLILDYYQGLRMWSRVIPFDESESDNYVGIIKALLLL